MDQTIQPVTETERVCRASAGLKRASALLACLLSASGGAHAQTYIDLTTEFSQPSGSPGFGPGVGSGAHSARIALPMEVTLQDFYSPAIEPLGLATALIVIRNIGRDPLVIPVSRDLATLKANNQDRRWLDVHVTITAPAPFEPVSVPVAALVGSKSVPGSLLTLAPQESVTLRVHASLSETSKWHDAGMDTAKVTVGAKVTESYFDSKENTITSASPTVSSKNEVEAYWHH